jgi:hypothetical protein
MEKLIIIAIIVAGSAIYNWIKRRQEDAEERERETNPDAPNRRPPPIPPERREQTGGGWEEELRRLLQGDSPTPAPRPPISRPKPPAPPPVIKPVAESAAPRPFLARSSIPVPDLGREMDTGLAVRPVSLDQATAAHERASQLQAGVVQRMQDTAAKVSGHARTPVGIRRATNADRLRSLLRQKESQRTIILASIILGPPRAMEP